MAYAQVGRLDKARASVESLFEPQLSVEYFRVLFRHFRRKEDLALYLDALRKAGVPQWPFGFEGRTENRLDGAAVRTLAFGRTWTGHTEEGLPFMQKIGTEGTLAFRSPSTFIVGTASVEGDSLCLEVPAFLMGRQHCGFVYQNPDASNDGNQEYIYVNVDTVKYFVVEP